MLHGTAGSSHSWHGVAPALAEYGTVICVDLPGHHLTKPKEQVNFSLADMTHMLHELIASEGWSVDIIIGHSAGAAIAVHLAQRLPRPPQVVISVAGALKPYGGFLAPLFTTSAKLIAHAPGLAHIAAFRANNPRAVRRLVQQTGSRLDELGYACMQHLLKQPDHIKSVLRMMAAWDLSPLEASNQPLPFRYLAIEMAGDTAVPAGQSKHILKGNPTARLVRLRGLGHLGHEEAPARVVAEIVACLELDSVANNVQPA